MREILFKAKRFDTREWIEGYFVQQKNNLGGIHSCIFQNFEEENRWEMKRVHLNTVCQYTGLTDKNSRKIFEGDICKYCNPEDKGGVAIIEDDYANWISGKIREKELLTPLFYLKCGEEWEVIGNIFDNPELIGEQP